MRVMFAPLLLLFPLLRLDVVRADSVIALEQLAMLPLMFLAMLRRRGGVRRLTVTDVVAVM
ncbi:hypothetical protein J7F04_30485, partial [Streptomyces sp. ISL-24]|nr:hypothetical protein [Streptomyces sp. ISL-24]